MNTERKADTRTLVAACAAITVFGFAFGMTYPLLSLILEKADGTTIERLVLWHRYDLVGAFEIALDGEVHPLSVPDV